MRIITGVITTGVTLAAGDSPVLIGGVITNDNTTISTVAVYGGPGVYADIRNAGTVGDANTRTGIQLSSASTITNGALIATHALIEGATYGVLLAPNSTVTNYGSIIGGFAGARIASGGEVTNGSTADTTALISGGPGEGLSFGEFSGTGLGTVVNFGTITSAQFVGVDVGGAGGQVINGSSADTLSLISGYGDGIRMISGAGTISNFGTIRATAGQSIGILGGYGSPLTITNGSSSSTTATITGHTGVYGEGPSVVTNFATIMGIGASGAALHLRNGSGTVVNGGATSTKALLQGDFAGAYLSGSGKITNFGKIEGGGVGILLLAGGTIVNGSSADTTALIGSGIDGIDVSGTVATTITNFGTIEGVASSILFGGGNDKLIVEPGAKFIGTVDGGAGTDTVTFAGGGTLAVSNIFGFETFVLSSAGADTLTLTNANFADLTGSVITVTGGSAGNTVNASALTGANAATLVGGAGTDKFTGGAGADTFKFSAANLAATDTVAGGGGSDHLIMTTAGTVNAAGVSGVETFELASGGADTLTLANANFAGVTGASIKIYGGSGGNTIDASALTGTNRVVLVGGAGTDNFTGGAGNDIFEFATAALAATDKIAGGGGSDELMLTTTGTANVGGVSGVETYALDISGANTLTLTHANFAGAAGTITVAGGNGGNTLNAAALTGSDTVKLVGGTGSDVLTAAQHAMMTGGGGVDTFIFTTPGTLAAPDTNTIADFTPGTDKFDFSDVGFNLGLAGASSTPQALPSTLFASNSTGSFTSAAQRFAYNTTTGALHYDAQGNAAGSTNLPVATLTGHPALAATDLFFTT